MEVMHTSLCRICLAQSEFNVSLFDSYCRRTNMIDKIFVCLNLTIKETELLDTICYKCAENIERYYDFKIFVKKSQTKLSESRQEATASHHRVTSYVRQEVFDDTFTTFEASEEKKTKHSNHFYSYFAAPSPVAKIRSGPKQKTPYVEEKEKIDFSDNTCFNIFNPPEEKKPKPSLTPKQSFSYFSPSQPVIHKRSEPKRKTAFAKQEKPKEKFVSEPMNRRNSRNLIDSQSQETGDPKSDWNITPVRNILKQVRDKCFGRSDF